MPTLVYPDCPQRLPVEEPDLGLQHHQPKSRLKRGGRDIHVWNIAVGELLVLGMEKVGALLRICRGRTRSLSSLSEVKLLNAI